LRRFGRLQQGGAGKLRIVDGLALGPRDRLVLVQVGNDQVLLGVTPGNIQALHVLAEALPSAFQSQLSDTLTQGTAETA
jgi:flagellar protein FliO/FliZ